MLIPIIVTCIVIFASMQLSSFATTIYLHRSLAHKGLRLHPAVAMLMRVQLWLFTGIVTREWVAVHRKHHHFADEDGDPHSPHLRGLWNVLLWNAVYYSREANKPEVIEKYTKDMPSTRADLLLNRGWLGLGLGLSSFVVGFGLYLGSWLGPVVGAAAFVAQGLSYIVM